MPGMCFKMIAILSTIMVSAVHDLTSQQRAIYDHLDYNGSSTEAARKMLKLTAREASAAGITKHDCVAAMKAAMVDQSVIDQFCSNWN